MVEYWQDEDLSNKKCSYGSCKRTAWAKVTYRPLEDNTQPWKTKHVCHKHYMKKYVGNLYEGKTLYTINARKSTLDYRNNEKPT